MKKLDILALQCTQRLQTFGLKQRFLIPSFDTKPVHPRLAWDATPIPISKIALLLKVLSRC